MRYEITITCTEVEEVIAGKEWDVVGTREVERDPAYLSGLEGESKTRIEEVRDYTPEVVKKKHVTREILKQNVETLDLAEVIRAINNL